jgi:hypothetical protein
MEITIEPRPHGFTRRESLPKPQTPSPSGFLQAIVSVGKRNHIGGSEAMIETTKETMRDLERHVHERTNWRVRNFSIEVGDERAVLRGRATTNFTRQLAQHAVQDLMPRWYLENAIDVDNSVEFILGLPLH